MAAVQQLGETDLEKEDHHEDIGVAGEASSAGVPNTAILSEQFDHVAECLAAGVQF